MQFLSLREFECEAKRRLEPQVYDFFAGGADDEVTLRCNEAGFGRIALMPRVLRDTANRDLAIDVLGCRASMPVMLAPTAFHRLAHPAGECATARAAAAATTIMILSMVSTVAIEDVAAAAREASGTNDPHLWFQLYIQPDLEFTETIIRRAEAAGCTALVVSVDSPVFGRRERDLRNGFVELPPGMFCENLREPSIEGEPGRLRKLVFAAGSWSQIDWLRKITTLKIVFKGVMHPEDARIAVKCGVDALFVSNHGGRQLDTVPAAIELLPPIADAVGGNIPLFLDGGIRRGTDVLKALALGAAAVAIGRPVLWALAVAGEPGVTQMLEMLRAEIDRALALCGCRTPRDLNPDFVRFPQHPMPIQQKEGRC